MLRDGVASHLHRHLRDAGQRPAVRPGERREVADDEDVRGGRESSGRAELSTRPARSSGDAERRAERRGRHAGRPQHGLRARSSRCRRRRRPADDAGHDRVRAHVDAEPLEIVQGGVRAASPGTALRIVGPAFEQDDPSRSPDRSAGSRAPATAARSRRARRPSRRRSVRRRRRRRSAAPPAGPDRSRAPPARTRAARGGGSRARPRASSGRARRGRHSSWPK